MRRIRHLSAALVALLSIQANPLAGQKRPNSTTPMSMQPATPMRMVMATDDAKAFRLIRPLVAAMQIRLAEEGLFDGAINGLMGPSTQAAVAAYQRRRGRAVTGLPRFEDVVDLMGGDGAQLRRSLGRRLDLTPKVARMGMMPGTGKVALGTDRRGSGTPSLAGMKHDRMPRAGREATEVEGDPHPPKSLTLTPMPAMVMRNRHTAAVASVREVVAAIQAWLGRQADVTAGVVDGRPDNPGLVAAISAFQTRQGLEATGRPDLPTALSLFGGDIAEARARFGVRFSVGDSPVAMDADLMRRSASRGISRQESRPR